MPVDESVYECNGMRETIVIISVSYFCVAKVCKVPIMVTCCRRHWCSACLEQIVGDDEAQDFGAIHQVHHLTHRSFEAIAHGMKSTGRPHREPWIKCVQHEIRLRHSILEWTRLVRSTGTLFPKRSRRRYLKGIQPRCRSLS